MRLIIYLKVISALISILALKKLDSLIKKIMKDI